MEQMEDPPTNLHRHPLWTQQQAYRVCRFFPRTPLVLSATLGTWKTGCGTYSRREEKTVCPVLYMLYCMLYVVCVLCTL